MRKFVINNCYGGFGLSESALQEYKEKANITDENVPNWWYLSIERDDPILVEIVERDSLAASGRWSDLKIVEIPDDVEWEICEYDGLEWIAEKHRKWY